MGMYTALSLGIELRRDCPADIVRVLQYLVRDTDRQPPCILPKHDFFQCDRWRHVLTSTSYSFSFRSHRRLTFDDVTTSWHLTSFSSIKNYSDEIGHFLDWIAPFLDESMLGLIGWRMYEAANGPTLLYAVRGAICEQRIAPPEVVASE